MYCSLSYSSKKHRLILIAVRQDRIQQIPPALLHAICLKFVIVQTRCYILPCSEGACIVVKGQQISTGFSKEPNNPRCFMVYEDPRTLPPMWQVLVVYVLA